MLKQIAAVAFGCMLATSALAQATVPPPRPYTGSVDPGGFQDATQGYSAGSIGVNTATGRVFYARSVAAGAAVWLPQNNFPWTINYTAGNWYIAKGHEIASTANAIASTTTMALTLFYIPETVTISDLGSKIQTVGTTNYQLSIYAASATTALPTGTPLATTGNIVDTATGTSSATLGSNVQLSPGLYWLGVEVNDVTVIFVGPSTNGIVASVVGNATLANLSGGTGPNMLGSYITTVTSFGTWPDLTSATLTAQNNGIKGAMLFFKVASVP